jgi:predicted enzyme related to lactoylglutathione lyase
MIKEFTGASIWTEDLNNLLPFYRDVLGLNVAMETPGFAMVGAATPEATGLLLATHSEVRGKNTDPHRHMVGFASDDLQADWKRLKEAGVEFIEDPTEYPNDEFGSMWIATMKDPDGNLVQLFEWHANEGGSS